jgi:tRNA threonylcarbamoyladenosine biosynthesis protein TsaB
MLLAIDTATQWTGLALHYGRTIVAESGWRANKTQTMELAPAVNQILRRSGYGVTDLAAIAVAIGPGSYTGLRIGLAFAKGFALANQTKLIGVPTLDIVAAGQAESNGQLVAIAEAGRTRVCAAFYSWQGSKGWQSESMPEITDWDVLLAYIDKPAIFAGEISPEAAKKIKAAGKGFAISSPAGSLRRAGYLAEIGWNRLRRGWTDDPATLAPVYLRDPAGK